MPTGLISCCGTSPQQLAATGMRMAVSCLPSPEYPRPLTYLHHGVVGRAVQQQPVREQAQQVGAVHGRGHQLALGQILLARARAGPLLLLACAAACAA